MLEVGPRGGARVEKEQRRNNMENLSISAMVEWPVIILFLGILSSLIVYIHRLTVRQLIQLINVSQKLSDKVSARVEYLEQRVHELEKEIIKLQTITEG